jgi:hypothetical protein
MTAIYQSAPLSSMSPGPPPRGIRSSIIPDFLTSGGFRWGFPESDLALFHPTSCIMGEPTRHQYRRGYDASPTRMAAPFALRLA